MKQFMVAFQGVSTDDVKKSVEDTGMKVVSCSCDHVTCEGGWLAQGKLKSLCSDRNWQCAPIGTAPALLASFVFVVSALTMLILSLYGAIVFVRCHRDALGTPGAISIGEATVLAIVAWLGVYGLMSMSKPR